MFNFLDAFDHDAQDSVQSEDDNGDFMEEQYRTDSVFGGANFDLDDHDFTDKEIRKFETFENQRVWMGIFNDKLLPHERPSWSDKDGKVKLPKNAILLPPDGDWKWQMNWCVEKDL